MTELRGKVHNGQVVLDHPTALPDGTEVVITPRPPADPDGAMTPEEIARVLAAMDRIEPLDLSDEEQAAWATGRSTTVTPERADYLRRLWDGPVPPG